MSNVKMRLSELAHEGEVPLATVKFYLREGLLPAGRRVTATQADYGPDHLRRLRLVRALVQVGRLPLDSVRSVLAALESPGPEEAVSAAHGALTSVEERPTDEAEAVVRRLGWRVAADTPALRQLAAALDAIREVGLPDDEETLTRYARAAEQLATDDVASVPTTSMEEAVAYIVLGTALYEPLLLALRRLAHQSVFRQAPPD